MSDLLLGLFFACFAAVTSSLKLFSSLLLQWDKEFWGLAPDCSYWAGRSRKSSIGESCLLMDLHAMVRSSSASLWRSCDWCSSCCWGITALLLPGKISHLTRISLHLKFFPQVDTRRSPLSQQSIFVKFLGILWVLKLPDNWKSSIKLVWSDRYMHRDWQTQTLKTCFCRKTSYRDLDF